MQETLKQQMEREVRERAALREEIFDIYGEDRWSDSTVVRFWKWYEESMEPYPYVAIRAKGLWYVGGQGEPLFWVDFVQFVREGNRLGKEAIWLATNFVPMYKED